LFRGGTYGRKMVYKRGPCRNEFRTKNVGINGLNGLLAVKTERQARQPVKTRFSAKKSKLGSTT
jgi:hypothetical protein